MVDASPAHRARQRRTRLGLADLQARFRAVRATCRAKRSPRRSRPKTPACSRWRTRVRPSGTSPMSPGSSRPSCSNAPSAISVRITLPSASFTTATTTASASSFHARSAASSRGRAWPRCSRLSQVRSTRAYVARARQHARCHAARHRRTRPDHEQQHQEQQHCVAAADDIKHTCSHSTRLIPPTLRRQRAPAATASTPAAALAVTTPAGWYEIGAPGDGFRL